MAQQRRFVWWRLAVVGGVLMGIAASIATLPSGASATAPGTNCSRPLRTVVSARLAKRVATRPPGPERTLTRHLPGGAEMKLTFYSSYTDYGVIARMAGTRSRVCGLRIAGEPTWTYAPVSTGTLIRPFRRGYPAFTVSYARRNAGLDGASCANPYVIADDDYGTRGDRQVGRVSVTSTNPAADGTVITTAHWQASPGYRICLAAGQGLTAKHAWVDRRQNGPLSHVINTMVCCPDHRGYVTYFFAAFTKA